MNTDSFRYIHQHSIDLGFGNRSWKNYCFLPRSPTSAPSCQFLFSAVFVFQVFRPLKVLPKIRKNQIKNQRPGSFRNHQGSGGGPPPGDQEGPWRGPTLGRARRPLGFLVGPLDTPLRLYLALGVETPNTDLFSANSPLYRRRRFKIGATWRSCPGTLSGGGTPSGRPSIAMDASQMCRE